MSFLLFIFGAAFGSFINVVALRYDPDKFLFAPKVIGGRSHCPHCHRTLRWFELIPIVSFFLQAAHCRRCAAPIAWRYVAVELLAGALLLLAGWGTSGAPLETALWGALFLTLLLIALIDLRLTIIPDEANIIVALIGIAISVLAAREFGALSGSFLGPYAMIFGGREQIVINRVIAILVALAIFGSLVLVTRGRGMGLGDVKLAVALAIPFGWPDIALLTMFAFVLGSIVGGVGILLGRTTMKGALPFGPFLALAAIVVFVAAEPLVAWYFTLFRLIP